MINTVPSTQNFCNLYVYLVGNNMYYISNYSVSSFLVNKKNYSIDAY